MSGVRTINELQEVMAAEFAWRRKELHGVKSLVLANEGKRSLDLHIRGGVTLLYAHWEGFVKEVGGAYLEFVAMRRLKHDQLSPNFLAMAVAKLLRSAADGSADSCLSVIRFFRAEMGTRSELPWKLGIDAKSNLNSKVFREIAISLGLDYSHFATREKLIDEKLLGNRNKIAHGKRLLVDSEEYLSLHDEVLQMMDTFYNLVENSALTGAYRVGPLPYGAR